MLPDAQLLTIPITFAHYKPKVVPSTSRSLAASKSGPSQHQTTLAPVETERMAHRQHRLSRSHDELWFTLPSPSRRHQERSQRSEQSAYQATSNRFGSSSTSARTPPRIPIISTSSDLNKPLPPSPSESEKRKRKSASFRGLLRRESSNALQSNHLRPEPYLQPHANSDTSNQYYHNYSRSMPNSPLAFEQAPTLQDPATLPRARSAAANYQDTVPYQPSLYPPQHLQTTLPVYPQRSSSMNTYFEATTPPRSRTFPEATVVSPTAREAASRRPRPHTWLSPTETVSDVHLFAQALTGLPNDSDPFSPNGPPQLQGSLFARRNHNDTIPLPLQHPSRAQLSESPQRNLRNDWQNFEPPPTVQSRSLPAASRSTSSLPWYEPLQQWQPPPHMNAINVELEMLGLDGDHAPDDELPDYAQSQAEMDARRRATASARARELEARWRGTVGH